MAQQTNQPVAIFSFFDYREYLQAVYAWRKVHEKGFSHRVFSQEAGLTSSNYLHRILKRERTLSEEYCKKFCIALNLKGNEARYFSILVQFNNESEATTKEALLRSLLALRYHRGIHRMQDKKLQFFSKWYYPILRELAVLLDFKKDFNLLARSCLPKITAQQAENGIAYLLKNGFLATNENGKIVRTDPIISSGNEVSSTILRNYHKQTLTQCIDALDIIEKENRDIASLTLSVSRKTYLAMKKEIQDFRKRLLAMAKEDQNPEMVCLAGFQLLPRSKRTPVKQRRGTLR